MSNQDSNISDPEDPFADRRRKREEMFAASPIVELTGIFLKGGGGHNKEDGQFSMSLDIPVWKVSNGELRTETLYVDFTSSRDQCDAFRKLLTPYTVYRFHARVLFASEEFDYNDARLIELLGIETSDDELNQSLIELQKPVTYQDSELGIFTLDRDHDVFMAETLWGSQKIELTLVVGEVEEIQELLSTAHQLWKRQVEWNQRILDYAVQEMLPIKNDSWLDDGEQKLSAKDFLSKMNLEGIVVSSNDSFEFWFDDGEMFGYHMIFFRGDFESGLFDACLG